jgi:hypothetical protein
MSIVESHEQNKIDDIHNHLINIFVDLNDIVIIDLKSRQVRENMIFELINIRRSLDSIGIRHSAEMKGASHGNKRR